MLPDSNLLSERWRALVRQTVLCKSPGIAVDRVCVLWLGKACGFQVDIDIVGCLESVCRELMPVRFLFPENNDSARSRLLETCLC